MKWVAKELAIVLPYHFDSDLQYNLRQGWRHAFSGYCNHCSRKKLNNWLQRWSSLRCCNQSVHVYQNCLEQSQKHVWNGAYDHVNCMETRLYLRCNRLQLSNSHVGVLIDLTIKWYFIELEQLNKANWNINDLQWTIHMPTKLTSTLCISEFPAWPSPPGKFFDGRIPHPRAKKEFRTPTPGLQKRAKTQLPGAFSSIIHYKNMKKWDRSPVKLQDFIIFRWSKDKLGLQLRPRLQ